MYTLLILLIMIFIPIPVMMRYMLTGRNAYRGILEGSMSAMAGVALVFVLFWSMTGATFFEVFNTALNQVSIDNMNLSGYHMMGIRDLQPDAMQAALDKVKEMTKLAVPGMLIVICMVITYFNYGILSWAIRKSGRKISVLPPFRTFALPRNIVLGSVLIYVLSYLIGKMGIIDKSLLMFNLELLFTFIFSIQGLAVIFSFGYFKKIPKLVVLIISCIFIVTWFGQTFLFLLGLTDIVFDIRKRISQTYLKK